MNDMFKGIQWFDAHEWPEGILEHVNTALIKALDIFRDRLGRPVHPSPLRGAWARLHGSETSRHYAVGRKSDAGDVFVEGDPRDAWLLALSMPQFGGIGYYADTQYRGRSWPMLHVDLRPRMKLGPMLWVRVHGTYYYAHRSDQADRFWKAFITPEPIWD